MTEEDPTLIIHLGSLAELDDCFREMKRDKSLKIEATIAKKWGDVVLAGTGPKGTGDLYVFVGRLIDPEPDLVRDRLYFKDVERFWHPVVAVGCVG